MDWRTRLKNKTFLITFVPFLISTTYQLLTYFSIVPSVDETSITELALQLINVLALLGIVINPTTNGITDSE